MIPSVIQQWAVLGTVVFAAAPARRVGVSPSYYYVGLGVLVVLMLIAAIKAYRMWEELQDVEEPDKPSDLLEAFEEAHAAGELDDEEFERVRQRLVPGAPDGKPATPPVIAIIEEDAPGPA